MSSVTPASPELVEGLERLRQEMLRLFQLVSKQVEQSVQALLNGNADICDEVIQADELTDDCEKEITEFGFELLSTFRPGGRELRLIIGSMNVARTLERLADHSVQVAKRSRKILRQGHLIEANLIEPVYTLAMQELSSGIAAFFDRNVEMAQELAKRDRALDKMHKQYYYAQPNYPQP